MVQLSGHRLPWAGTGQVVYWGIWTSHGFSILNRLRSHLPDVSTVLMDITTLEAYQDLAVIEPRPATAALTHLLPEENAVVGELAARGNLRLEQERLDWAHCLEVLLSAANRPQR
ncbi:Wadjet anti-phage system protein JetD domain-containing protein [Arthrobacter castelli]|uniref:Wadjet anti-phage system protein JetD domain-containing protein n=1 Tax=Arthrobacter castelli TaxID=271431 RepID=UPI0004189B97|nr:Wadjet anti-phage system protein JetD domain-containing protein [Arthrobacter castelli]